MEVESAGAGAGVVGVDGESESRAGAAEMWMREKRCFSFEATMSCISGRVALRERMLRLLS